MRDTSHISRRDRVLLTERRGFTLVEMTISLGIIAILMVSLGTVVALAGRAVTSSTSGSTAASATARTAVDMITSDLQIALTITEQTSNAVTFTVPARGADVSPEKIRYAWDGVSGHPLTRAYNNGAAVSIADNVMSLNLTYLTKTVSGMSAPPATTSDEQLLASHDGGTGTNIKGRQLTGSSYPGQFFIPTFPTGTVTWGVTRIRIMTTVAAGSPSGNMNIALYAADTNHLPTGGALACGTINTSLLSSSIYRWMDVVLPSPIYGLSTSQGLLIVPTVGTSNGLGTVAYDSTASTSVATFGSTGTSNSGSTWTASSGTNGLQVYIYGTFSTQ
jgi:prepilin-type N-terminal cleavage/methylation domain-containing protein